MILTLRRSKRLCQLVGSGAEREEILRTSSELCPGKLCGVQKFVKIFLLCDRLESSGGVYICTVLRSSREKEQKAIKETYTLGQIPVSRERLSLSG